MEILALVALVVWCAALSWIDLERRRLPNALTLPGAALIIGYGGLTGSGWTAAKGALLLAVPYLLLHLLAPAALGAGDVKLALGLGAATALGGAQAWVSAALAAPLFTALLGTAALLVRRGRDRARPGRDRAMNPHLPETGTPPCPDADRASVAFTTSSRNRHGGDAPSPGVSTRVCRGVRPWDSVESGRPETTVPHGPSLCAASLLALVVAS